MNLEEYIASGILEAYALGDLGPAEMEEVRTNIAQHPGLREELKQIELDMEQLMVQGGTEPHVHLRSRVLESVENKSSKGKSIRRVTEVVTLWRYATAAAVVIAISSSALAYIFWSNWKRTETDLNDRIAMTERMAEDYGTVNQRLDKIEGDMRIYDNPGFRKVVLAGTSGAPDAMATVYWNEASADVYISLQNMKGLSQDNQYQLWAIIDGKPVDMGMFDGQVGGLIKMKSTKRASAFAVTIEPRGGKPSPTMNELQVMGHT